MEIYNKETMYYYINKTNSKCFVKNTVRIAAFDLDNTLIKTKSGNTFSISPDDWDFMFNVVETLVDLSEEYIIIIFTNQLGISTGKNTLDEFQQKLSQVIKQLPIITTVCIATAKDVYRKPFTGMWTFVRGLLAQMKITEVDLDNSFYVGDALGRPNDFSNSDLCFAKNIGLPVKSPEEFFENKPTVIPPLNPLNIQTGNFQQYMNSLFKFDTIPVLMIMVGPPASGKSSIARYLSSNNNFKIINQDTLKTLKKCICQTKLYISSNESVIIDNTNPSLETRKLFIELARNNYKVICCKMITDIDVCKHLNNARYDLSGGKEKLIPALCYNIYKSKLKEPCIEEGFTEIIYATVCIDTVNTAILHNRY